MAKQNLFEHMFQNIYGYKIRNERDREIMASYFDGFFLPDIDFSWSKKSGRAELYDCLEHLNTDVKLKIYKEAVEYGKILQQLKLFYTNRVESDINIIGDFESYLHNVFWDKIRKHIV